MPEAVVSIKNYLRGPWSVGHERFLGPVPLDRRLLPEDILKDGAVLRRRNRLPIHGVLDLLNRTGQGFTARGVPLYLFYPLDPAWPPFYVSYKDAVCGVNLLATIVYEHWNSGVWPRGGLVKAHGPVGNTSVERDLLIQTYAIGGDTSIDDCISPLVPVLGDRVCVTWDAAFNIDPDGCEDVDDIFAWRCLADGVSEFMIAIADVSAWIPSDCAIDMRARALGQTLYDDGAVVTPMLPPSISTRAASLRCDGVARPVVGRVYTIRDGIVVESRWQLHVLTLTHSFTYSTILKDTLTAKQLYEYLKIVCKMPIDPYDSHDWVAQAMITYNHAAAVLLSSVGLGVLRRHGGCDKSRYSEIAEKSGCYAIAHLGMLAGEYISGSSSQTNHSGLGLDVYCHASSPLRRYSDLVNQRVLKYLIFGHAWASCLNDIGTSEFVDHLNSRASAARHLERELWFLTHIQPDKISTVTGIVLECKDNTLNLWSLFVPKWRRKITGVPCTDSGELTAGCSVNISAYCDLRRPAWSARIVCQLMRINA